MSIKGGSEMSNSVDLDHTPRSLTFDLGLHGLLKSVCPKILCNYGMEKFTNVTSAAGITLSLSLYSLPLHKSVLRYLSDTLLVAIILIGAKAVSVCVRARARAYVCMCVEGWGRV